MGGFERQFTQGYIGENKEFSVANTSTITLNFNDPTGKTSANDNATTGVYYTDVAHPRRKFVLRCNQSIQINKINGVTLTDPISVVIGDGSVVPASAIHKEEYDFPTLISMEIEVLTANTNIKLRVY